MDNFYVLTFENTHGAMSAEKILKASQIKNTVMPTPTHITKSCGLSIRFDEIDINKVKSLIQDGSLKVKQIYFREQNRFQQVEI